MCMVHIFYNKFILKEFFMKNFICCLALISLSAFGKIDLNCKTYLESDGEVILNNIDKYIEAIPFSEGTTIAKFKNKREIRHLSVKSYMNFVSIHFQKERDPKEVVAGGWEPWKDILSTHSSYVNNFGDAYNLKLQYSNEGVIFFISCTPQK